MSVLSIRWDFDPIIFTLGTFQIRWYGLMFVLAFTLGTGMIQQMLRREGAPQKWIDSLLAWMIGATVVGSRLGHVLFYEPERYLKNPVEIFKIWEGGLASHGGAIGIVLALWIFSRWQSRSNPLWILDRMVIPTALGGFFIRTGNFFNSEIFGYPTSLPWGVEFVRAREFYPLVPRHPSQIYEALAYLLIFALLYRWYWRKNKGNKPGFLLGMFFLLIFAVRFIVEFLKEDQVGFEQNMWLNMGQWLSLPFIAVGIWLVMSQRNYPNYLPLCMRTENHIGKS